MHKLVTSRLLLLMFLVGAASGFFVSLAGWWGLNQTSINLALVEARLPVVLTEPGVANVRAALLQALKENDFAQRVLLSLSGLATIFFCLTAWITYRESAEKRRQSVELEHRHALFRTLFEGTGEGVILMASDQISECNGAALRLFGIADTSRMQTMDLASLQPARQPDGDHSNMGLYARIDAAWQHGPQTFEWYFQSMDGREFPAETGIHAVSVGGNAIVQITIRDITRRKQDERSMRLANQAFEHSQEGIAITDEHANILTVNRAFTAITGYSATESTGRNPRFLASGRQPREFYRHMWQTVRDYGKWQGEIWNKRKNGETYPQLLNISRLTDDNGHVINYVGVFSDISETKLAEERLLRQSTHDLLTDLPNRALFTKRLQQALPTHEQHDGSSFGVLLLDIDRFKMINDSIGHDAGDHLLLQVAQRLRRVLRESDTLARMGGDEYALLALGISDADHLASLATKLLQVLQEPFILHTHELHIGASIGLALYPIHGAEADMLIKHADIALYHAKSLGKNRFEFYSNDLDKWIMERMQLENCLHGALSRNELLLHYQPQKHIESGTIHGVETLVRWHHPELGMISPAKFIPVAEETGLIVQLGKWILRTACAQARQWMLQGFPTRVAVNVSAHQFHHDNLVDTVTSVLNEFKLPAALLEIELTEGVLMDDIDHAITVLNQLHAMGVQISIDDFGTGYSSLSYLKRLSIQVLKIDQSFVRDIPDDLDDCAIVSTIILLAHNLKLKVIAEGVETEEQLAFLRDRGCDVMQGYYFSRPLPAAQLTTILCNGIGSEVVEAA
ncbi:putative bifunctional diguanylate cyclase/phosphodiesterase [Herbaspirillum sp. GCM10030257]|uniref:putative bifunctional diguanylate cyclase/phosphodiesterase n=1 Tax=Herbaspirillum sp. GCM10030257 TaxID=3273393 RepID=UPI00360877CD